MPEPQDLLRIERGAIFAPTGHGRTGLIAKVAGLRRRKLILTHTNASMQSLRGRLKRMRLALRPHPVSAEAAVQRAASPRKADWDYRGLIALSNVVKAMPRPSVTSASANTT
jgi:hypothetical protein